ncbi:MAG TPA: glycosyltransferase [Bryobacteraceae bacterium]|nr:glycosyltransferase [Bryobacteraceae bacterium]
MRLLIVCTVSATVEAFMLPFADHFRRLGWKVDALANGVDQNETCRAHFDELYGIEWSRRPWDFRNLLRALNRARAVVTRGGYDIIHVHTPIAAFVLRLALKGMENRPAIVYTVHGFHFQPGNSWFGNAVFLNLERLAGRWTDFLVTMNRTDELAVRRFAIVPAPRSWHMPGIGIDRRHFRPHAVPAEKVAAVRRRFRVDADAPLFVMIAEFTARKRHRDAVAAFSRMKTRRAHLIFVGAGPGQRAIESQASAAGVSESTHFAGAVPDVRPYILAARAVVLPSSQEGLPRSVMESLCCGIPVLGSDIRGTRDLLENGGGLLFPVGDVNAFASLLDWFVENPAKAMEMGSRAEHSMGRYDIAEIIKLHEELYAKATAKAAVGAACR